MSKKQAKFISFEGIEGAGKSSAILSARSYLSGQEVNCITTREPGGTIVADKIRAIFADVNHAISAKTELLLLFASRQDHIDQVIQPALLRGDWVLTDRFVDATYAYQGGGRGLDVALINQLTDMVCDQVLPDLVFVLDLPESQMEARLRGRGDEKDRIENEKLDFFCKVRECYLQRAKADPKRYCIIDASMSMQDVAGAICQKMALFL